MKIINNKLISIPFFNQKQNIKSTLDTKIIRKFKVIKINDYLPYQKIQKEFKKNIYQQYDIQINENTYFGKIKFVTKGYWRLFCLRLNQQFIILSKYNLNRCMHGQQVYFKIIKQTEIKVIGIKENKYLNNPIIGQIKGLLFQPLLQTLPLFQITNYQYQKNYQKSYYFLLYQKWEPNKLYPQGKILYQYGQKGNLEIQSQALLKKYQIITDQFSQQCHQQLFKFTSKVDQNGQYIIPKQQYQNRKDLRKESVITIDPTNSRDFDDALSIKIQKNGNFSVGIHIADVSYFVSPQTILDTQAKKRIFSIYLVEKHIPMLPQTLCQKMCSLNPNKQRLTITIQLQFNKQGQVIKSKFYNSIIKSICRLSYKTAQDIIDKKIIKYSDFQQQNKPIKKNSYKVIKSVLMLNQLAKIIRTKRQQNYAIFIEETKKKFTLDQENFPISLELKQRIQSQKLIQQFMILANKKVAQALANKFVDKAILRNHQHPDQSYRWRFKKFLQKIKYKHSYLELLNMNKIINTILKSKQISQTKKKLLNFNLIKFIYPANYFISGQITKHKWHHFALNISIYTHFTSPIRRYPDIIAHRLLKNYIKNENVIYNENQIKELLIYTNFFRLYLKKINRESQDVININRFLCISF